MKNVRGERWGVRFFAVLLSAVATSPGALLAAEDNARAKTPAKGLRLATFDVDATPPVG